MPEPRTAHPYYLYDAIHAQPALIEKVLARRNAIDRAADAIAEKDRITFVGIGTSLHAAQIAELWMREFTAGRIWPHFEQSFELVNHPIAFGPRDAVVVITHTGTTTASVAALRAAREAGALTVAITGEMSQQQDRRRNSQRRFSLRNLRSGSFLRLHKKLHHCSRRSRPLDSAHRRTQKTSRSGIDPASHRSHPRIHPPGTHSRTANPRTRQENRATLAHRSLRRRSRLAHRPRRRAENQRKLLHRRRRI